MRNRNHAGVTRRQILSGAKQLGLLAASSAALPFPAGATAPQPKNLLPIGMNLSGIADWEPGFPFNNLMWGARPWMSRNVSGEGPWQTELTQYVELDENGYPLEIPFSAPGAARPQHVFTIVPNVMKPGKYVLLFEGEGTIAAAGASRIVSIKPGRIELMMAHRSDDDSIEEIQIRASKRGNHIRNMRLVAAEHEHLNLKETPFRPELLDYCKPWHCLRFMDWLATNHSRNVTWSRRQNRDFYTQVGKGRHTLGQDEDPDPKWDAMWASGIPIDICIQLANAVKRDAWFCVPHLADDNYIEEMATLVRDTLDPSLKVYVEYSNELWNWQFVQAQWALRSEVAGRLVAAGGKIHPWEDNKTPQSFRHGIAIDVPGSHHPERIGALFSRCFKIWEKVFSGQHRSRLVRVCAVQNDWLDNARRTLDWVMTNGGCDALSPGGYFGPDEDIYKRWDELGANLTAEQVVSDMRISIAQNGKRLASYAKLAREAGIELVIYEGGQHIQPEGQQEKQYSPALAGIQKRPEMYELYIEHLKHHAENGCTMFGAFASISKQGSRYGSWGHLEYYGQPASEMPKQRALLDANVKRP